MNDRPKTLPLVIELIVAQLGCDAASVQPDSNLVLDLGADSLDSIELHMSLEEEFDILIPDAEAEALATPAQIVAYLDGRVTNRTTVTAP